MWCAPRPPPLVGRRGACDPRRRGGRLMPTMQVHGRPDTRLEWTPDDDAAMQRAAREFDRRTARGLTPTDSTNPAGAVAHGPTFDPNVESVTFLPRMAGG